MNPALHTSASNLLYQSLLLDDVACADLRLHTPRDSVRVRQISRRRRRPRGCCRAVTRSHFCVQTCHSGRRHSGRTRFEGVKVKGHGGWWLRVLVLALTGRRGKVKKGVVVE